MAAELLLATGIRVVELAGLRDDDIDLTAGVITIIRKGSRQRRVYVPDSEIREEAWTSGTCSDCSGTAASSRQKSTRTSPTPLSSHE